MKRQRPPDNEQAFLSSVTSPTAVKQRHKAFQLSTKQTVPTSLLALTVQHVVQGRMYFIEKATLCMLFPDLCRLIVDFLYRDDEMLTTVIRGLGIVRFVPIPMLLQLYKTVIDDEAQTMYDKTSPATAARSQLHALYARQKQDEMDNKTRPLQPERNTWKYDCFKDVCNYLAQLAKEGDWRSQNRVGKVLVYNTKLFDSILQVSPDNGEDWHKMDMQVVRQSQSLVLHHPWINPELFCVVIRSRTGTMQVHENDINYVRGGGLLSIHILYHLLRRHMSTDNFALIQWSVLRMGILLAQFFDRGLHGVTSAKNNEIDCFVSPTCVPSWCLVFGIKEEISVSLHEAGLGRVFGHTQLIRWIALYNRIMALFESEALATVEQCLALDSPMLVYMWFTRNRADDHNPLKDNVIRIVQRGVGSQSPDWLRQQWAQSMTENNKKKQHAWGIWTVIHEALSAYSPSDGSPTPLVCEILSNLLKTHACSHVLPAPPSVAISTVAATTAIQNEIPSGT